MIPLSGGLWRVSLFVSFTTSTFPLFFASLPTDQEMFLASWPAPLFVKGVTCIATVLVSLQKKRRRKNILFVSKKSSLLKEIWVEIIELVEGVVIMLISFLRRGYNSFTRTVPTTPQFRHRRGVFRESVDPAKKTSFHFVRYVGPAIWGDFVFHHRNVTPVLERLDIHFAPICRGFFMVRGI